MPDPRFARGGLQSSPPVTSEEAVNHLSDADPAMQTAAAATLRRRPPAEVVPALLQALERHGDSYVRFRALVLLSAFNHPRIPDVMREATYDPNDRVRQVAYSFFERHPDVSTLRPFLEALERETSELVVPAMVRAVAALGDQPGARKALLRELTRGTDLSRRAIIEALGDQKAAYALGTLIEIARVDGPLQGVTALALGKLGDPAALPLLTQLRQTAPTADQPAIAAGLCLLGNDCDSHRALLVRGLTPSAGTDDPESLVRQAATALSALAASGDGVAAAALVDAGMSLRDAARAAIAQQTAIFAVRNPSAFLPFLQSRADVRGALTLLAEGFDMLDDDLGEEQFFAVVRRSYWSAPEDSGTRATARDIIGVLGF
jgi:HEAT repeat protein